MTSYAELLGEALSELEEHAAVEGGECSVCGYDPDAEGNGHGHTKHADRGCSTWSLVLAIRAQATKAEADTAQMSGSVLFAERAAAEEKALREAAERERDLAYERRDEALAEVNHARAHLVRAATNEVTANLRANAAERARDAALKIVGELGAKLEADAHVTRLGRAVALWVALERNRVSICLHTSWITSGQDPLLEDATAGGPGSGFWIALVRPADWRGAPLGRPVVGTDLVDVLERAAAIAVPR